MADQTTKERTTEQSSTPNRTNSPTIPIAAGFSGAAPSNTLYAALFLFLFAIYLFSYTPRINSSDGLAMFSTAESIVRRGALDIEQIRWMGLQQGTYGLDGLLYSRKGIGVPLGLLPLTWLGLVLPGFGPVTVSLLFNAIVTAMTAVLLMTYLQQLGFTLRTGLIVALTFGLATLAWPYAKSLFSDPLAGLLLLAAAYTLLRLRNDTAAQERRSVSLAFLGYLLLAGLLLGWNVATRYAEVVFLPVYGLLLLYYLDVRLNRNGSILGRFWAAISAFSAPILLIGLALLAFNLSRYGDPFNTGYLPNETFSAVWWRGIVGQLVSPGRGLLLYCPILILSLWGMPVLFRRFRAEAVLALSIILIHLLLYGKWFMWHGGYAWGPRFMIPTLPFWAIFLAPVAERTFNTSQAETGNRSTGLWKTAFFGLALLSLIPQFLAVTIDFAPFQNSLLETGLPLFAPQTFFDPRYSPLLGAWDFISRTGLDFAWAWQGQINGWLWLVLVINITISGFYLVGRISKSSVTITAPVGFVVCLSTLGALLFLLTHSHNLPDESLQTAVTALNEGVRPTDGVVTNDPERAMPFAERYKGRAPVLGLNSGGFPLPDDINRRLNETIDRHRQIWWLPHWLPPEESAVEQILVAEGLRVLNDSYGDQRLVLFIDPADFATQTLAVDRTFADSIKLYQVAYPPNLEPGLAFPVELQWQALTPVPENYHVFIHLVTDGNQLVAQADGQPARWTRPTSSWIIGEKIVDQHGLWLPPDTRPGAYQLRVGLYNPTEGQRLSLSNGADAVEFSLTVR